MVFCDWLVSLAWCFAGFFMLGLSTSFFFFFWQITLHCTDLPHLIYLCISWWTFGFFPLLWITLLWTPVYKFLCGHMFCIFLVCIKAALLGHTALLCEQLPDSFSKWLHHFASLPAVCEGSSFSISMPTLVVICLFLRIVIPLSVQRYLTVVLTYISLMAGDKDGIFICSQFIFEYLSPL